MGTIKSTLLGLLLLLGCWANAQKKDNYAAMAAEVMALVNAHRAQLHLQPLATDEYIAGVAAGHNRDMASGRLELGHDGFDDRMKKIGQHIKGTTGWAENVADGARTAKQVVDMWLHSPEHRENIEGNYNRSGIAIAKGVDGQLYFTQIFCKSK